MLASHLTFGKLNYCIFCLQFQKNKHTQHIFNLFLRQVGIICRSSSHSTLGGATPLFQAESHLRKPDHQMHMSGPIFSKHTWCGPLAVTKVFLPPNLQMLEDTPLLQHRWSRCSNKKIQSYYLDIIQRAIVAVHAHTHTSLSLITSSFSCQFLIWFQFYNFLLE